MKFLLCLVNLIFQSVLSQDIKDLTFEQLVQLGKDTLQVRIHDVNASDVNFYLFTREKSNIKIDYSTTGVLDLSKNVKFVVHGFIENHSRTWYKNITEEYLKYEDLNVIQVDWERPARSSYFSAAYNTKFVGNFIADFILSQDISLSKTHIVGHSLGAHVAGFTGKAITKATSQKLPRITGLDPAGPYFIQPFISKTDRLDKDDAIIVDVIHTDAGFYGYPEPIGTLDMYFNGGTRSQPGCLDSFDSSSLGAVIQYSFCSHTRSYKYFTESINSGLISCKKCESRDLYESGECDKNKDYVVTAETVTESMEGTCFSVTSSTPPYLITK